MKSVLALLVLFIASVSSYPTGAPEPACAKLAPIHKNSTYQNSTSPYTIVMDNAKWESDGHMTVTIKSDVHINGFILQARKMGNGEGIGMFDGSKLPNGTQTGPCMMGMTPISVTHTNPSNKTSLTFEWMVPENESYFGEIYFQGAVAQNHDVYWVDLKSMHFTRAMTTTPAMTTHNMTTAHHNMTTAHHNMTTAHHNMTTAHHNMTTTVHHNMTTTVHHNMTTPEMTTHHNMTSHEMTTPHNMTVHVNMTTTTAATTTGTGSASTLAFSSSLLLLLAGLML